MSTVTDQFRQAREAQNLTVQQVAELTKMRGDHVRAFEEGNFSVFSAPVYIRGFARTYCKLLKLDTAQMVSALDRELNGTEQFSEPPPLSDNPKGILDFVMLQLSKLNKSAVQTLVGVAVFLVILAIVLFVWREKRGADPLKGVKPGMYEPAAGNSGDTLALPARR
ncbi:MAG: helix-turn-helix domain-containing protein [Verrucomicrobiota bacterium]